MSFSANDLMMNLVPFVDQTAAPEARPFSQQHRPQITMRLAALVKSIRSSSAIAAGCCGAPLGSFSMTQRPRNTCVGGCGTLQTQRKGIRAHCWQRLAGVKFFLEVNLLGQRLPSGKDRYEDCQNRYRNLM
jgi:hypothetical protein